MRVQGTGPVDATLCLVHDTLGHERELARYLSAYRLPHIEDVFVTHLVREYGPAREPSAAEIARDWPELQMELLALRPPVIVTLGPASARALLGDDIDLARVHGLPHAIPFAVVVPCYEPAARLYESAVAYDFTQLAGYLAGTVPVRPKDTCANSTYHLLPHAHGINPDQAIALSVEGTEDAPWSVAFTQRVGTGTLLRRGTTEALAEALLAHDDDILLHDALHALPVLRRMGVTLPHFTDLKVSAALLNESLDLTTLAYRHCGMALATEDELLAPLRQQRQLARQHAVMHGQRPDWTPPTLDDLAHPEIAIRYAGRKADAVLRLFPLLNQQLVARDLVLDALRDTAVLVKIDTMRQAGDFINLTDFTLVSSSVWPEPARRSGTSPATQDNRHGERAADQ